MESKGGTNHLPPRTQLQESEGSEALEGFHTLVASRLFPLKQLKNKVM